MNQFIQISHISLTLACFSLFLTLSGHLTHNVPEHNIYPFIQDVWVQILMIMWEFLHEAFSGTWDPSSHWSVCVLIYFVSEFYDTYDELLFNVIFKSLVGWQEHWMLKCFKYVCDFYMHPELVSSNIRLTLVFYKQYFSVQNKTTPYNIKDFICFQIQSNTFWWTLLWKNLLILGNIYYLAV